MLKGGTLRRARGWGQEETQFINSSQWDNTIQYSFNAKISSCHSCNWINWTYTWIKDRTPTDNLHQLHWLHTSMTSHKHLTAFGVMECGEWCKMEKF